MEWWSIALILAVILIPLCYALYCFGLLTSHATFAVFRASCSLPTRWEGKIADTTGFMRRNFVVFPKYSALSVDVETTSGTLEFEVRGPDGVLLSPVSGHYGRDASLLIDVSQVRRCSVSLRMDRFHGMFRVALQ